jgi:YfiH family protein
MNPIVLTPHWPDAPGNIGACSTLRSGGASPAPYDDGQGGGGLNLGTHVRDRPELVQHNRALLQAMLPGQPLWLNQVHGTAVVEARADASPPAPGQLGTAVPDADASFARERGAVCLVMSADCLPVLFSDAQGRVIAAAHAGWRGLAAGVLGQTVAAMRAAGAGDIVAWMGPAIGPRQFEVGEDVRQAFLAVAGADTRALQAVHAAFAPVTATSALSAPAQAMPAKYLADIYALARFMLKRDGVDSIAGGEFCTVSEPGRFYSFRRDGVTGRQASLIWRK